MFETYTEKARRVIFFARYEASQYGCDHIETEHILLGILREDKELAYKVSATPDVIRTQIEGCMEIHAATSTSVDLPLSDSGKRVLAYAAEESERLSHRHVAPKHLLLGVLREENSFAAEILRKAGLRVETLRVEFAKPEIVPSVSSPSRQEVSVVTITSQPTGAEIEVDGKFLGNTPAEVPLTPREWTIRITKAGFAPCERKLLVLPQAKQNIAVDLVKAE